jgi:serine/threonine protein kinase
VLRNSERDPVVFEPLENSQRFFLNGLLRCSQRSNISCLFGIGNYPRYSRLRQREQRRNSKLLQMSLVGWRVEWKSSFREYEGVVIEHTKDKVVVWEYRDLASYEWNPSQKDFKRWNPALKEFASYHRLQIEKLFPGMKQSEVCRRVISEIENIRNVPTILNAKKLAVQIEQGKLESALIEEGNMEDDKDRTIEVHKNPQKTPRKLVEFDFPEEVKNKLMNTKTRKGEDNKKQGGDVDGNNERESSEEEDGEKEDDEEDDDEEEDDDSEETESDDEDEEEEEDDEESDYEDKQVDIKIMILHTSQTRGFSVKLNSEGMKKILSKLQLDYSERISLFYRDDDGDVVNILSSDDLLYAYRTERKKLLSQSSSPEKNKKDKKNKNRRKSPTKPSKLKLFAELSQTDPMDPITPGHHFPFTSPPRTAAATQEITRRILNPADLLLHHTASLTSSPSVTIERRREGRGGEELEDQDIVTPSSLNNNSNEKERSGTYDIIWKKGEVLGVGSFGKVFSGLNISNGMKMAIKEVSVRNHHNTKNSKLQVKALQREVAILARLDHPNIIKYLGTEFSDNTLRIFLEIATEGSLKDSLREFGAFPEPLIRCYANDIVAGLNYLHSCKIIHRDIKPANLLLSHGMVKLADFGCSSHSILHHPSAGLGETEHSTVTGTTIYMAPEVMQAGGTVEEEDDEEEEEEERVENNNNTNSDSKQGEKDNNNNSGKKIKYGRKADIWSLGMTLCELSTGNAPYKNGASAIYCVCVSKQLPSFPGLFTAEAHHFLQGCLTYEVEKRADAWELQEHVFLSPKVGFFFSLLFR